MIKATDDCPKHGGMMHKPLCCDTCWVEQKLLPPHVAPEMKPCGECQACCETLANRTLMKNMGERCWHQRGSHGKNWCSVYIGRPLQCRNFDCLWRKADIFLPDSDRPDRSFVLADVLQGVLVIREVCPGAFSLPSGAAAARRVLDTEAADLVALFPWRYAGEAKVITLDEAYALLAKENDA